MNIKTILLFLLFANLVSIKYLIIKILFHTIIIMLRLYKKYSKKALNISNVHLITRHKYTCIYKIYDRFYISLSIFLNLKILDCICQQVNVFPIFNIEFIGFKGIVLLSCIFGLSLHVPRHCSQFFYCWGIFLCLWLGKIYADCCNIQDNSSVSISVCL